MKNYLFSINRLGLGNHEFHVQANSFSEAERNALQLAYDHQFSDTSSQYEIESWVELNPDTLSNSLSWDTYTLKLLKNGNSNKHILVFEWSSQDYVELELNQISIATKLHFLETSKTIEEPFSGLVFYKSKTTLPEVLEELRKKGKSFAVDLNKLVGIATAYSFSIDELLNV